MTDEFDDTLPDGGLGPPRPAVNDAQQGSLKGKVVDGYRILKRLGGGRMGEVYLAEQSLGAGTKLVALKTMRGEWLGHDDAIERFQEEAYAGGTLKTAYVAQVFASGTHRPSVFEPALHYLVMEYCSGGTLLDYLVTFEGGRLPPAEAVRLLRQAADGLLAAERRVGPNREPDPLVHRDLKPENLLLQRLDAADLPDLRIADFGAVKRHQRRAATPDAELSSLYLPMTPAYASPEQWEMGDVDHRSDMYSLGATFYHALTGRRAAPRTGTIADIRKFTLDTRRLSPGAVVEQIPEPLDRIIERMTARDRDDRYDSFADVLEELRIFEAKGPVASVKAWLAAALVLVIAGVAVWYIWPRQGVSAADLARDYSALHASIQEAQRKPWIADLPDVARQLQQIEDRVETQRREVDAAVAAEGDEATVAAEANKGLVRVQLEFQQLDQALASAEAPLAALHRLEDGYSQRSRAQAREALDQVALPADLPAIATRWNELNEQVEALFQSRRARLRELERDFVRGVGVAEGTSPPPDPKTDPYGSIRSRAMVFRDEVGGVEPELRPEAGQLVEAIDAARALELRLPSWPGAAVESESESAVAAMQLDAFVVAVGVIGAVAPTGDTPLARWWASRRRELATTWKPRLLEFVAARTAAQQQLNDGLQEVERAEALRRLRQEVAPAHGALVTQFRAVRAALPVLFPDRAELDEVAGRLDAGRAPQVGFLVQRLRDGYVRVQTLGGELARVTSVLPSGITPQWRAQLERYLGKIEDTLTSLAAEQREWIGEFEPTKPWEYDDLFRLQVNGYRDLVRRQFVADELDLARAAAELPKLRDAIARWEPPADPEDDSCSKRFDALVGSIGGALELLAGYESGERAAPPTDLTKAGLESLAGAVFGVFAIKNRSTEDQDLAAWCDAWGQKQLDRLLEPILNQVRSMAVDVVPVSRALEPLLEGLDEVDPARAQQLRTALRQAEQQHHKGRVIELPASWSGAAKALWPPGYDAPPGLECELRGGVLIGWFPCRTRFDQDRKRVPVEMVLVTASDAPPFLVDRHEVTAGELLALGVSKGSNDPGGYLANRGTYWSGVIGRAPAALLSWTAHAMAAGFAAQAYSPQEVIFELPTASQWSILTAGGDGFEPTATEDPTAVVPDERDQIRGVVGLRSGLSEWLADGSHVGARSYAPPTSKYDIADWKKGVGFRCVLNLKK
ncbi:MAG: protein kinase [Planctomycetes bacterium]|nr:protein kinase [Planctomycetota bacterium]